MSTIGTAGWTIPALYKAQFPRDGSHLERYAARLNGVEINSSFYSRHKRKTYERWAATVPVDFRFSVKVPRTITQHHRLANYGNLLQDFLEEVSGLGDRLGVLLVQLPPSLAFDAELAKAFFNDLARGKTAIACEPRHGSWFADQADTLLKELRVVRVAADPPRAPFDNAPGGDTRFAYFRLHGNPKIYYSDYSDVVLRSLVPRLHKDDWCIFDNTAASCALGNALSLKELTSSFDQFINLDPACKDRP